MCLLIMLSNDEEDNPIFLNMYKLNLKKDFGLFDFIQRLKYQYFTPSLDRPFKN